LIVFLAEPNVVMLAQHALDVTRKIVPVYEKVLAYHDA
jgi:hypothetical protein